MIIGITQARTKSANGAFYISMGRSPMNPQEEKIEG